MGAVVPAGAVWTGDGGCALRGTKVYNHVSCIEMQNAEREYAKHDFEYGDESSSKAEVKRGYVGDCNHHI